MSNCFYSAWCSRLQLKYKRVITQLQNPNRKVAYKQNWGNPV